MKQYLCTRKCQFPGQHRRREGELCWFEDGVSPPPHFVPVPGEEPEPVPKEESENEIKASMRMNHDDLLAMAKAQGLEVDEGMTKKEILALMEGDE